MPCPALRDKPGDLLRGEAGRSMSLEPKDPTLQNRERGHPEVQNRSTHGSPAPAEP
jgi:hypothetical protein